MGVGVHGMGVGVRVVVVAVVVVGLWEREVQVALHLELVLDHLQHGGGDVLLCIYCMSTNLLQSLSYYIPYCKVKHSGLYTGSTAILSFPTTRNNTKTTYAIVSSEAMDRQQGIDQMIVIDARGREESQLPHIQDVFFQIGKNTVAGSSGRYSYTSTDHARPKCHSPSTL